MKPRLYLAIAGIPPEIGDDFASAFVKSVKGRDVHLLSMLKLDSSQSYTEDYAKTFYDRFARKLKKREFGDRANLLRNANLVLLYLDKQDESESALVGRFGIESLMLPLALPKIPSGPIAPRNRRNNMVNRLIKETVGAIRRSRSLLSVIVEEVTNRDNKTS